jgi:hypothetical protein
MGGTNVKCCDQTSKLRRAHGDGSTILLVPTVFLYRMQWVLDQAQSLSFHEACDMKQCTDDYSHVLLPLKTFDHHRLTDIANIDVLILSPQLEATVYVSILMDSPSMLIR